MEKRQSISHVVAVHWSEKAPSCWPMSFIKQTVAVTEQATWPVTSISLRGFIQFHIDASRVGRISHRTRHIHIQYIYIMIIQSACGNTSQIHSDLDSISAGCMLAWP